MIALPKIFDESSNMKRLTFSVIGNEYVFVSTVTNDDSLQTLQFVIQLLSHLASPSLLLNDIIWLMLILLIDNTVR
jgi:hypothetical protein